jgi:hypothetical protein
MIWAVYLSTHRPANNAVSELIGDSRHVELNLPPSAHPVAATVDMMQPLLYRVRQQVGPQPQR